MDFTFAKASEEIIAAGQYLNQRGWAPATSGNYSVRLNPSEIAMTVSGRHKGYLTPNDILKINQEGQSLCDKAPSAETLLHTTIYKRDSRARAILHTHSVNCTVITRLLVRQKSLSLEGYELLKAFPGVTTHDTRLEIPILENSQDMTALSKELEATPTPWDTFLIRGHGLYAWGITMEKARFLTEALEFMMECEIKTFALLRHS